MGCRLVTKYRSQTYFACASSPIYSITYITGIVMNFSSARQKKQREIMQQHVGYAQGSVKQYLNIKRSSKDRCCTVLFCLYMLVLIMLAGIGFFYGNFSNIGLFLADNGSGNLTLCPTALQYNFNDTYTCVQGGCAQANYKYLQRICVLSNFTVQNSALSKQITAYGLNLTLPFMLQVNVGVVIGLIFLFVLLVCFRKAVYFYIFTSFVLMLGFAFYLLKATNDRVGSISVNDGVSDDSGLLADERSLQPLAYVLLAAYLVLFPVILFAPASLKMAVRVLSQMYKYFESNYTMVLFSVGLALLSFGTLFLLTFLLLNFLTAGTTTSTSFSFFYLYEKVYLAHPALLAFFFFGCYWLFVTLGAWQQYALASSVVQWYFEDGGKLKPVQKAMKRAWYNLGSGAIDGLLLPFQWLALLLYSIAKMDSEVREQYENQHTEDCMCFSNLLYELRSLITKFYIKVNRGAAVAGALTNNNYVESCELASVNFSDNHHRFFNVGGSLTLFLNLFATLTFLTINYLALYYENYGFFPAKVSSLSLQVVLAVALGLCVGQNLTNVFGTAADTILFCFLMEKRGGVEVSTNEIKKALQELYAEQEQVAEVLQMYEIESDTD